MPQPIHAPYPEDPALMRVIEDLRSRGEVVVVALPGEQTQADAGPQPGRRLCLDNGEWRVVSGDASPTDN